MTESWLAFACRRAWVAASLTPIKDMELLVAIEASAASIDDDGFEHADGEGLSSPAFARGVHAALRAILDGFGINSFNVGMLSMPLSSHSSGNSSMLLARIVSRGHSSKAASDFGCLEVRACFSGQDAGCLACRVHLLFGFGTKVGLFVRLTEHCRM